jgi:hypothetical protein
MIDGVGVETVGSVKPTGLTGLPTLRLLNPDSQGRAATIWSIPSPPDAIYASKDRFDENSIQPPPSG